MKRFGIIGAGRFGLTLAESLVENGAEVILMDRDGAAIQSLAQSSIKAVQGDATNIRTLRDTGIASCDVVVIAIGDEMEGSVLATVNCKEIGVKTVLAKASTDLHGKVLERVGADVVVYPNRDRALRLARSLLGNTPIDLYEIADGYSVAEVSAPKTLVGKTLRDAAVRQKYGITVLAIRSQSPDNAKAPRSTIIATGEEIIAETDILVVFGSDASLNDLRQ